MTIFGYEEIKKWTILRVLMFIISTPIADNVQFQVYSKNILYSNYWNATRANRTKVSEIVLFIFYTRTFIFWRFNIVIIIITNLDEENISVWLPVTAAVKSSYSYHVWNYMDLYESKRMKMAKCWTSTQSNTSSSYKIVNIKL